MTFNAKRTSRFRVPAQIRADEEMVKTVAQSAETNRRTPGQQILWYVEMGMLHEQQCLLKAQGVTRSHGRKKVA